MSRPVGTLMPFLYPSLTCGRHASRRGPPTLPYTRMLSRSISTQSSASDQQSLATNIQHSRLDLPPEDYSRSIFADKCSLLLQAGSGGHGCVSFLREKFTANGPANGGDGGSGGNIYIQAISGETSLHKIARKGMVRAGRGRNGQGKSKGGQRGEDVLLQVPVGTMVREISRYDPVQISEQQMTGDDESRGEEGRMVWRRNDWILAPSALPSDFNEAEFPAYPRPRRSNLAAVQPPAPIMLDLSKSMEEPMLLVAGAVGGLGNPRFVTKSLPRPKFATKGDRGMRLEIELELKLLADLGFVGMPNAGKSTLLRSLSRSRARVGDWAFTTLQPNIGTVVLDDNQGRARIEAFNIDGELKTQFSIADIPGLVPDAHLDKGLGLDFLRHVERARVLAFVVDLSTVDPVDVLKSLWKEVDAFERLKESEIEASQQKLVNWRSFGSSAPFEVNEDNVLLDQDSSTVYGAGSQQLPALEVPPISTKPWFVVATKADLAHTQERFVQLQEYLHGISSGNMEHPNTRKEKWKGELVAIPVSAIQGEGVDKIVNQTVDLLAG